MATRLPNGSMELHDADVNVLGRDDGADDGEQPGGDPDGDEAGAEKSVAHQRTTGGSARGISFHDAVRDADVVGQALPPDSLFVHNYCGIAASAPHFNGRQQPTGSYRIRLGVSS